MCTFCSNGSSTIPRRFGIDCHGSATIPGLGSGYRLIGSTVEVMNTYRLRHGGDDINVDVIRLGDEPVAVVADGYARVTANLTANDRAVVLGMCAYAMLIQEGAISGPYDDDHALVFAETFGTFGARFSPVHPTSLAHPRRLPLIRPGADHHLPDQSSFPPLPRAPRPLSSSLRPLPPFFLVRRILPLRPLPPATTAHVERRSICSWNEVFAPLMVITTLVCVSAGRGVGCGRCATRPAPSWS